MKYLLLTALFCSIYFHASTQVNLNQGLIAYYSFNGSANDVSGQGNNPIYNSATLTTDRYGNVNSACYFDGVDDYITVPGSAGMNTATAMTVAMYFNTELTTLQNLIGKIGYNSGEGAQFQVAINFNQYPGILYGVNNPADLCNSQIALNSAYVNTGGTVPTNQWHCLVCTYEAGVQKIYLNGLLVSTNNTSFNVLRQCANSDIQIGSWWQNDQQRFKGKMDDVRIYNRALNQTEVNALCLANLVPVTAGFTAPDTVCVNTPVAITNTSTNATTNYWTFCTGNLNAPPVGANLGILNGGLTSPVYIDYVLENGNYYGFMTDNSSGILVRLEFGNSLLNTPTSYNLGNFNGPIPNATEGIQVVKNEGKWYAIIVGGTVANNTVPSIMKIEFGANITNNTPVATNWGNIGGLAYPHDLYLFVDNTGVWHGLTVNTDNNTITRFNFTNSFSNTPTGANLGNIGNLTGPTGICPINDNGNWYAFVTNANSNTLTRLDFGNSLFNVPTGQNLGNVGGVLRTPWDIQVIKYCGELVGYVINANQSFNDLIKLNFTNITSTPTATSFGNIGNMRFPHCLSKIFRSGADLYTFVPNVINRTVTRLRFTGCNTASTPNSTSANPGAVTYNTPGTYNITLTVDDGLPTQTTVCKQVVVLAEPTHTPTQTITICSGDNVKIGTGVKYAQYSWNTGGATTDSIIVNTAGTYWVQTDRFGCSNRDSIIVNVSPCTPITAQFTTPDTVCVNTPVTITNTTAGASSYYWNFCVGDLNTPPAAVNIGNPNSLLTGPVFMDYVYTNGNYYGFAVNFTTARLVRLDYGNSLLNPPIAVNLGNYGGLLQNSASEGIQVVQNEGKWYAIIVGGSPTTGTVPRIVKIDFGANITSPGVPTDWGNIGNLDQPIDLHVFKEGANWYGFTINAEGNTITRFNFTNSFNNTPTAVNLGNIGGLLYPTGIHAINDNGFWRVFITNAGDNQRIGTLSSLTRLDFGTSLLNTPTGVNLGNPGNVLKHPRDFTIMKFCGQIIGFAVNGNASANDIVRLNFNNDLTSAPTLTSLGNLGNLNFPHSISKLFRVNDDVYAFITNVSNNTITRLRFAGCTNASVSSSTDQNPAPVTYNTPGTYNINLTVDDGLPTQTAYCKQVVVMPALTHTPTPTIYICSGTSIKIGTGVKYAQYTWNTGAATDSIIVNTPGTYWVQMDRYGCSNRDSIIVSVLADPVVNLGADTAVCSFNNFVLNAGNAGATFLWQNGSTGQTLTVNSYGKYYVQVTQANGCVGSDTINITQGLKIPADFYYKQDICNPLSVQFFGVGANLLNPYWDFGDGNTITGTFNPVHAYPGFANYTVKFGIESGVCKDTITKVISINVTTSNLILTPDTTICFNTTKQLRTQPALGFCWAPTTYLDNPAAANPVTSTPGKFTYYFMAEVTGNNLIVNGDFSNASSDFNSQYRFTNPNVTEGEYFIGTHPQLWNPLLGDCRDHTTGASYMLMVNGSSTANATVWSKPVTVLPNTNYAFSAWLQNLNIHLAGSNPARLQFSINGHPIGNIFQSNITSCIWEQFYETWNSGNNTTAIISVVNQNTLASGNDFALDDISFAPVFIQRDSVIISVDTPVVRTNMDTTICTGRPVQLQASGAATWSWTPATGLTNASIANPVATPANNTNYIVTGTTVNGCTAKDTVAVNLFPIPTVISAHDVIACPGTPVQLAANNSMVSYAWTPAATLNNPAIANPMATPATNTRYTVQVTDANQCSYSDTVHVALRIHRFSALGLNPDICRGDSVTLKAVGGHTYLWSPAGSLDDATKATPVATPDTSTWYQVYMTESNCNRDTTIAVRVIVNPTPTVTAEKTNDIDCVIHSAQLNATGSAGNAYRWLPASGLDQATMPNPVSTTDTTITYKVTGTNQYGCAAVDSVTVNVTAKGKVIFEVPNAFTPNGDSRNDCFGVKSWGGAVIEEFAIFNRWGERVFSTKNAMGCWDGRFKGQPAAAGGYVYVIKAKTFCGPIKRTGTLILVR